MVKDHGFSNTKVDPSGRCFRSGLHLAGMVLHHVDVDNQELHGEDRQGHRRSPEDKFIIVDV